MLNHVSVHLSFVVSAEDCITITVNSSLSVDEALAPLETAIALLIAEAISTEIFEPAVIWSAVTVANGVPKPKYWTA